MIKVAGGIMNTHSRWADCRMEILASAALRAGLSGEQSRRLLEALTTDDALAMLSGGERCLVMEQVMGKIQRYLQYRAGGEMETGAVVYSNVYGILGKTNLADVLLKRAVADMDQDGKNKERQLKQERNTDGRKIIRSRSWTRGSGTSYVKGNSGDGGMRRHRGAGKRAGKYGGIPDRVQRLPGNSKKGILGIHMPMTKDKERLKRVMQMEPEYWKSIWIREGR